MIKANCVFSIDFFFVFNLGAENIFERFNGFLLLHCYTHAPDFQENFIPSTAQLSKSGESSACKRMREIRRFFFLFQPHLITISLSLSFSLLFALQTTNVMEPQLKIVVDEFQLFLYLIPHFNFFDIIFLVARFFFHLVYFNTEEA